MSRPSLILPRIRATDVVDGARLDEHLDTLASQINGGLTAANLSPSYQTSSWSEDKSVIQMSNTWDLGDTVSTIDNAHFSVDSIFSVGVTPPFATYLLGCQVLLMTGNPGTQWPPVGVTANLTAWTLAGIASASVASSITSNGFAKKGDRANSTNALPCYMISLVAASKRATFSASNLITVKITGISGQLGLNRAYFSVTLAVAHQA